MVSGRDGYRIGREFYVADCLPGAARFRGSRGCSGHGQGLRDVLPPEDRAAGAALSQVGLTIGSMGAPLLTEWMSALYGWRSAFLVSGALGVPLDSRWLERLAEAPRSARSSCVRGGRVREMLRDRRYLTLVLANILAMTIYSLWTNWTTVFLVSSFGLTGRRRISRTRGFLLFLQRSEGFRSVARQPGIYGVAWM